MLPKTCREKSKTAKPLYFGMLKYAQNFSVFQDTSNRAQSKWKPQMPQLSSHSNGNSLEKSEHSED
jgi:hypothetical protein